MQTFLPFPSTTKSAACLDRARLGKQRVEARQILAVLRSGSHGWQSHPAVRMWAGYEEALGHYSNAVINEWCFRGYRNTMPLLDLPDFVPFPPWWGSEDFHSSHRAALLFKAPEWYSQFNWAEEPKVEYIWPT